MPGVISITIGALGFRVSVASVLPRYTSVTQHEHLLSLMRKDRFREAKTLAPSHPGVG